MNEHIDLKKILKDCPKGTIFYSSIYENVRFECINDDSVYPIQISNSRIGIRTLSEKGRIFIGIGECILFPSKEQRDWNSFNAPWYKKEKFDPKTFKSFDRVLVRDTIKHQWKVDFFSHYITEDGYFPYRCTGDTYRFCIPYNDETKHLVGTKDKAPEYYRYWKN